jgi:predicted DCC family thiol-disulfide oxidoreductase YuxK
MSNPLPVLIYDGHCHFCQRQALRLSAWSGVRLKLESFHDPWVLARYPKLTRQACEEAMQLILPNGRVFSGAAAAAEALRLNPWLGWASWIYYLPGIKQLADASYRWIAKNRYRFGGTCTDGSCAHH